MALVATHAAHRSRKPDPTQRARSKGCRTANRLAATHYLHQRSSRILPLNTRTRARWGSPAGRSRDRRYRGRANGPSAIRAFSTELQTAEHTRSQLSREIATALEDGKIVAYFQPQLCSDTGDVAGFQAMPRWMHPERGVLSESEILPAVEAAGLRDRMDQILLYNALSGRAGMGSRA